MTCSQKHGGNLLDMFYKDPKRWAYTFQVSTQEASVSLCMHGQLMHTSAQVLLRSSYICLPIPFSVILLPLYHNVMHDHTLSTKWLYSIEGNFEGFNFQGDLLTFCSSKFVDARNHANTCIYKCTYLAGLIFQVLESTKP